MTGEELDRILGDFAKEAAKGKWVAKEGAAMTFHFAKEGAPLNVGKVDEVERTGDWLKLKTSRGDRFAVGIAPLFAVSVEGASGAGTTARRAGF
ncbi:MAG: hypothetical protein KBF88_11870 [Polyangiaceae bacterium]|nr:hypothetical protein [Polyangiaceae bacterium]